MNSLKMQSEVVLVALHPDQESLGSLSPQQTKHGPEIPRVSRLQPGTTAETNVNNEKKFGGFHWVFKYLFLTFPRHGNSYAS